MVIMKSEERFTKVLFGSIMIIASWFAWGKAVMLVLGVLFILSALSGVCWACEVYKWLVPDNTDKK